MSGFTGKGTIFNRWDGSAWVAIANIKSIDGPNATRDTVDVTTLDSVGGYREFIGGLRDGGEVSIPMNFTAAGFALFKADFESEAVQQYQIVLPDTPTNTTLEFDGLVTTNPIGIPLDDVVTCDVTIKVSGQTDLTTVDIIASVAAISNIPVVNGTQLAAIPLPATVTTTDDDGATDTLAVVWNAGTPVYNGLTAGTYVFSGTITCVTGIINPDAIKASVSVVVAA